MLCYYLISYKKKKICNKFNEIGVKARENFSGVMYLDIANFDQFGQTTVSQAPGGGLWKTFISLCSIFLGYYAQFKLSGSMFYFSLKYNLLSTLL